MINSKNKILIISPHTDDAELGAGGFISQLIDKKKSVLWVVFSSARESVPDGIPKDILSYEFKKVVKSLKLKKENYILFDYSVRRLNEKRQEILEILVKIKKEFNPDMVIGPSLNDYHQDHQVVATEMVRAFKTSTSIISYELPWNNLKFENQMFVKLEKKHIESKIKMLNIYKSQISKNKIYFSEDFIWGHATSRGTQISTKYAEAFEIIRFIV